MEKFVDDSDHNDIKLIGLNKEELENYGDEAFWRRLRQIMIIIFWIVWTGMFIAAIVIVINSPKCPTKEKSDWWKIKLSYQAWIPAFKDSDADGLGDFKGAGGKLEKLRKIGIQSFWPSPVIKSEAYSYAVMDYKNVNQELGTLEDFKNLAKNVHSNDMYLIMELPMSTTSKNHSWFRANTNNISEFDDYYIWSASSRNDLYWTEEKGRFYMHYRNRPHWPILNWANRNVRNKLLEAAKFWIDAGADGLYLGFVDYLARTLDGSQTNWTTALKRLADFENSIEQYANKGDEKKKIALFTSHQTAKTTDKLALIKNAGLNYVINHELSKLRANSASCPETTMAPCLHKILAILLKDNKMYSELHPMWEFGHTISDRVATRTGNRQVAELLMFIQLLLPGSLNFYYGEEIGMRNVQGEIRGKGLAALNRGAMQWDDVKNAGFSTANSVKVPIAGMDEYEQVNFEKQYSSSSSQLRTFQKLAKFRQRDNILNDGEMNLAPLNHDIIAFSRMPMENSTGLNIYLALMNFGQSERSVDINTDFPTLNSPKLPQSVIIGFTSNVQNYRPRQNVDLLKEKVKIGSNQGIVFRF